MNFWEQLFPLDGSTPAAQVPMRLLRKGRRPFLLFPRRCSAAARCLDLYPAQTVRGRAAKSLLRLLLRLSVPIGSERIMLNLSDENPFVRFLISTSNQPPAGIPEFGLLAGNPASDSQRFVLLLFDRLAQPVAVVKAGLSATARKLIQHEQAFLSKVPPNAVGIPKLRPGFESPQVSALALDFVAGNSAGPGDDVPLPDILASWADSNRTIPMSQAPAWRALEKAAPGLISAGMKMSQLRERRVQAVIQHGDFAPWNIKLSANKSWTVLDWERGQLDGIPGWDWFHYVIQTSILVHKLPAANLSERAETLIASPAFRAYANKTGIADLVRPLLAAYLAWMVNVIKPGEGLAESRALLETLSKKWAAG